MKKLIPSLLLCLVSATSAFGARNSDPEIDELMVQLDRKRELAKAWRPLCEDGSQSHGECRFNDMTIFSGISCLAGVTERCDEVRRSQGSDGRWWRSPYHVDNHDINSFSRDQAKGALAYLVATKDVDAALRWQEYLESNDLRMCDKASNNRCWISLGTSQLFGAVWDYLGLAPASWMNKAEWLTSIYNPWEARFQPKGFPMHLSALGAWIRTEIQRRGGERAPKVDRRTVRVLNRRQPTNPFFKLLREGPTKEVAEIILEKCPDERPDYDRLDWAWQRDQESEPWKKASGHDCVFIINVFERELDLLNK